MRHAAPAKHVTAKTVLCTFLFCFLLFGAVLLTTTLLHRRPAEDSAETDAAMGRVRTVTLFFRKTVEELSGVVLLTVDTRTMEITVRGVAIDTEVGGRTVQELYQIGSWHAATQLTAAYGGSCDGVLSFSVSNVASFLVYAGDHLCLTLPEQMDILPAGENTLTPIQVADVLRYREWKNGAATQAEIHAAVVAAIINRYWVADRDLEQDFKQLTALCDERLSISQFEAIKEDLYALATHNDGSMAKTESG